jgi:hypothetical protein
VAAASLPSCRSREGTDALAAVVPPAKKRRQLAAIHAGYPRAFFEGGVGHLHLRLLKSGVSY